MKRRRLLVGTGTALIGAGCIGNADRLNDSSPTESGRPSSTEADSPSNTDATRSPDCTMEDFVIFNSMSKEVTVTVRLVEGWGRYRRGSPTATEAASPTETPTVTFADEVSIPPDGKHEYENLPEVSTPHRFEITVENGPQATDYIRTAMLGGDFVVWANIHYGNIEFGSAEGGRPTGC